MSELDKWWEKNGEFTCSPVMHFDKKDAERTWKAALGWALSSGSWENIVCNIKEELNAKT